MWLQNLNPEQKDAASHTEGPLLILAGAGSGKTTVLVSRTGYLIDVAKVNPESVLVLTFTNKAAKELKERVKYKLGDLGEGLWAGTFHSFGLAILRTAHKELGLPRQFGVIDGSDSKQILKELMRDTRVPLKEGFDLDKLLNVIHVVRQKEPLSPDIDPDYRDLAEALYEKYERRLKMLGVVDFESLLLDPLRLFESHPETLIKLQERFKYVMVDEFQDTNRTQMKLIKSLVQKHRNITVVGDDDQSIYGWRGAEVQNILGFPKLFSPCKVVKLERNYRSQFPILEVANHIIKVNKNRHNKVLKAEAKAVASSNKPEIFVYDNDDAETDEVISQIRYFRNQGYKNQDIAILYRSNAQGGMLEGALKRAQIQYSLTGGSGFFERTEVKDVLAYLRCSLYPNDVAFRRILNVPTRGIGDTTYEALHQVSIVSGIPTFKLARQWQTHGVNEKSGLAIEEFYKKLAALPETLLSQTDTRPVGERLVSYFVEIGYRNYVYNQYKDLQAGEKRWQLVDILGRILEGFVRKGGLNKKTLKEFLDSLELRDKVDEAANQEANDKVQLLTLHASKGLEFPVVVLLGIEEDILPHRRLGQDVDEERRLFYVGVTRAKEKLVLTRTRARKKMGKLQIAVPSRFLLEVPQELFTIYESGFRPVSESERKNLVAEFLKKREVVPT